VYAVRSLLAGRWIVVLVCYLDDSGKDPQNRITTVAGYIAKDDQWEAFEVAVEPWFTEPGVKILHAKDLHNTDGEFVGWSVLTKQAFVSRICQAMSPHLLMGMSMSAVKAIYRDRAAERTAARKRTVTPYTFCFNVIIDWILRDIRIGRLAHAEGVALILECGHENNPEAEEQFYKIRKLHKLENVVRSISFVPKDKCRAIQIADLLAFYSRRDGVSTEKVAPEKRMEVRRDPMMNLLAGSVPHLVFVATDFHEKPPA
jgi:hypothetical protein